MALYGWNGSDRIQFYIDKSKVDLDTELVPFVFRVSSDTGVTNKNLGYVFDKLITIGSSVINRKKVAFSQILNGEEQPLCCELDAWDHIEHIAIFWVKPLELSSEHHNIFYFYFDKTKPDNISYLSETNELAVDLVMDLGAEGTYDVSGVLPMEVMKIGNGYKMWYLGYLSPNWSIIYCESEDLTTWTGHTPVDIPYTTNDYGYRHNGTVLYDEVENIYKIWYPGYPSGNANSRIHYSTSNDGIIWETGQMVIDISTTPFNSWHSHNCTVLKENSVYKIWYTGYLASPTRAYIIYAESEDGLVWVNHQRVISTEVGVQTPDGPYLRAGKVIYKDGLYRIWLATYNGTTWKPYYGESEDGINWKNFSLFTDINTLGVYDTSHTGLFPTVFVEEGTNYFFYGGHDGSNWRMLGAKSASLKAPRTPSQKVWGDKFFSVQHLNSSYGYIDSTVNRLDIVSTNNVVPVSSNIESSALTFTADTSYIKLPTDDLFNIDSDFGIILFSNITSGNCLYTKGEDVHLYFTEHETVDTTDYFDYVGDPDPEKWIVYDDNGSATVSGGRLILESNNTSGDWRSVNMYTTSYFRDFDIEFEYSEFEEDNDHYTLLYVHGPDWGFSIGPRWYRSSTVEVHIQYREPGDSGYDHINSGGIWPEGFMRLVRIGTTGYMYCKHYINDSWILKKQITVGLDSTRIRIHHQKRYSVESSFVSYIDNFILNSGRQYENTDSKGLQMDLITTVGTEQLTYVSDTLFNSWKSIHFATEETIIKANTTLGVSGEGIIYKDITDININTNYPMVGFDSYSVHGTIAEVWFSHTALRKETLDFIDKNLKDELLQISINYVQGYITVYNAAVETKVLAYDKETKQLIGYVEVVSENGYYYLETITNAECFLIALDGGFYNHFILGNIFPSIV